MKESAVGSRSTKKSENLEISPPSYPQLAEEEKKKNSALKEEENGGEGKEGSSKTQRRKRDKTDVRGRQLTSHPEKKATTGGETAKKKGKSLPLPLKEKQGRRKKKSGGKV